MTKSFIPFLAFLVLLLMTIPSFDFATSVTPGWHTTIYPPSVVWTIALTITLLFVTIGYWLLSRQADNINWALFSIHFVLTFTAIIFIKFPSIFLNIQQNNVNELLKSYSARLTLIPVAWTLFIVGQTLFGIYLFRAFKSRTLAR